MSRFARPEFVTGEVPTLPEVEGGELAFEPVLPNPSILLDLAITIPSFVVGLFALNALLAQIKAILALFRQRRMKAKLRARRPVPVLAFNANEAALAAYNQALAGLFTPSAGAGAGAGDDDTTAAITAAELPEILPADQEPTGEAPTTYNASIGQADKPCE